MLYHSFPVTGEQNIELHWEIMLALGDDPSVGCI